MPATIFALASGAGRAGLQVVRLSGPLAGPALDQLAGARPRPREALLCRLSFAGRSLDEALVLWFAAPHSFTGEDVAELHLHGGRAVREAVFAALLAMGMQPAAPGAFSRRAVENGKFDLTRAEAIADLTEAETEAQARQALRQYDGALAALYEGWRAALIRALAQAEAAIDFSDDGVDETALAVARDAASRVAAEIAVHLDDGGRGEVLREGVRLAILGPPNAGKSSLLNALAQRDVAIVSETPGTTRDVIEVRLDLGGVLVLVSDTAGLRETGDAVEAEGVRRALAQGHAAHLTVLLLDGSADDPRAGLPGDIPYTDIVVWNKADRKFPVARDGLALSLKTGAGLPELLDLLREKLRQDFAGDEPALTRPRHRAALDEALAALRHASNVDAPELFAEDLRLAMRAIGRITGRVDVEEVLDSVFKGFCIGK